MAKFAVLLFSALAFQAAFAGVRRHHHHSSLIYGDDQLVAGHPTTGKLDEYVGQIQSVTNDVSVSLQSVLPNDRQVAKTLIWQNRELAQIVEQIINRLQVVTNTYSGDVDKTIQQVLGELKEVLASLQQTVSYTDVSNPGQLKSLLNTNLQTVAEQIEKLVYLGQGELSGTQGSLHATIKGVLGDYLTGVQSIKSQIQYLGQDVQGVESPKQMGIQIQELTGSLTGYLQDAYLNTQQVKLALRLYAQCIETIVGKLQGEVTVGNKDVDVVLQQLTIKLRQLLLPLERIIGSESIVNVSELRTKLVGYIQDVCVVIEQLVQVTLTGSQKVDADNLVVRVLYDYVYALKQVRLQIQGGYQGGLLGQTGYQTGIWGQSGLIGKLGYTSDYHGPYGQGFYQSELLRQRGLGKLQYGTLDNQLVLSGNKYGQSGKGIAIQIQAVASELNGALQNINVDNVLVRQTLVNLIRQYIQNLEVIVERLEQTTYTTGVTTVAPQLIVKELKQTIVSLQQIVDTRVTVNAKELINKLNLFIQNIVNELEKLTYSLQTDLEQTKTTSFTTLRGVLVEFLTVTRNLCIQVQNISQIGVRGQTTTGFGIQIQTLANGLTAALESVTVDNQQVRQLLVEQCRELVQYLETIVERIQTVGGFGNLYGGNLPQQVAGNLRQIIVALQQVGGLDISSAQNLKLRLISCIQDAATEIQKLLWVGQDYLQQGQGQFLNIGLRDIVTDFVALLQNQQIQLQGIWQFSQYGQGTQQLAVQIQAITNNLAIFLQNVPSNGEQIHQQIEVQIRRLVQCIENIIQRLEVEVNYTNEIGVIQQVVLNLKKIVSTLEQVTGLETSTSVYDLTLKFNVVLQNVASELRKLAFVAQYETKLVQGNLNGVIRNVLIQYLNVIQIVQVNLQGINQTVQIGQTPRELALQIEVVARRLVGMLRVTVADNKQTQNALLYQARRLTQVIDIIVSKLQAQITTGNGSVLTVLQQVTSNLKQIQLYLQQTCTNVNVVSVYQLKTELAGLIQDAAIEIQKLIYVVQPGLQQGQGSVYAIVRGVLIDFLGCLQNLQMQVQDNLQIVLNGQSPRTLVVQIQSVANRLAGYLQYVQPNNQQLRQTLVIQIGELTQTIENVVQLLQNQIKNNGQNTIILKEVCAELNKISLSLQKIAGVESNVSVVELGNKLNLDIQRIVTLIQKLAFVADFQLKGIQVDTYRNGVLNGVFNNVLATLRNILIQLQNTRLIGQFGLNTQELANQIQTTTNHLGQSLEIIGASTKQVKQALAIQALRYAIRIQCIVDKLESEVSYNSGINVATIQEVVQNLKHVVITLQQIGGSLTTTTIVDLRTQLNAQVQKVAAQIQKLLVIQSDLQTKGLTGGIVRGLLIEYLAVVQNLYIRVQNIAQMSQKGQNLYQLAIQIDTVISDLSSYFQWALPNNNKLVAKTVTVEARQLTEVIANIINKLQSISGVEVGLIQQVVGQLKQIELSLQQVVGEQVIGDVFEQIMQLEINVQRVAVVLQQLVWAVQPELEQVQINTVLVTVVREVLNDFLAVVQNVYIQVYNAVPITEIRQYSLGWGLQGQYLGQQRLGLEGLDLYRPIYGQSGILGGQRGILGGQSGVLGGQWGILGGQRGIVGGQSGVLGGQWGILGSQSGVLGGQWGVLRGQRGILGGQGLLSLRGQIESPQQCLVQIKHLVNELCNILQTSTLDNQQVKQIITLQVRQLVQVIENIVDQLQEGTTVVTVDTTIQQVIIRLREVLQSLRQIVGYTTFTSVYQLRTELCNCIEIVVAQVERLVFTIEQIPQGNLYLVVKNVLEDLLGGIEHIWLQIRDVTQYGQGYGYGGLYNTYNKGYGYDDIYNQYGNRLGYGGLYNQYGKGLSYENKLGQYWQRNNVLGGLYNTYGQGYDLEDQLGQYGDLSGLQGRFTGLQGSINIEPLIHQIQILVNQVCQKLQTVTINGQGFNQIVIVQARQLVQVIDNIIDRLQAELTGELQFTNIQQVVHTLRQIQLELQQIVRVGPLTTVYQTKTQLVNCIETITVQLNKLWLLIRSDVQVQGGINVVIRDVLVQYLVWLRSLQNQLLGNTLGLQTGYGYDVPLVYGRLGLNNYVRDVDDIQDLDVDFSRSLIKPVGVLDFLDAPYNTLDIIRGY